MHEALQSLSAHFPGILIIPVLFTVMLLPGWIMSNKRDKE
jgi:hypothetical protein